MKKRLMKKMIDLAVIKRCIIPAYPHIVKYCLQIGLRKEDVDGYIMDCYKLDMEKI